MLDFTSAILLLLLFQHFTISDTKQKYNFNFKSTSIITLSQDDVKCLQEQNIW
jgi:hypothetical protein